MIKTITEVLTQTVREFSEDEAMTRAAALSFYSALSFAPLLILLLWCASLVGNDAQAAIVEQFRGLMGEHAGSAVSAVIENAEASPSLGSLSAVVGVAALLFSATGVFVQLQKTLNHVWQVRPKPESSLRHFVHTRLLSLGMLGALGFLLLVSLVVSSAISMLMPSSGVLMTLGSLLASIVVFTLAFVGVYTVVPDCTVRTRDALVGAVLTSLLFALGKEAIGVYLGRSSVGSSYGAAGSLLVLLVWVYYTSTIAIFGAELTQVYAIRLGGGIVPDEHAELVPTRAHARSSSPSSESTAGAPVTARS